MKLLYYYTYLCVIINYIICEIAECKLDVKMWTKQQCYCSGKLKLPSFTAVKIHLMLSLVTPHAPAKHRKFLVRANRDSSLPATAEKQR